MPEDSPHRKTTVLRGIMHQFFGGSEDRYRHALNRRFIYTEGVKAVADFAGAYWLLDIIATEVAPKLLALGEDGILKVTVDDGARATLEVSTSDDGPPVWMRGIEMTDFPPGTWTFELAHDGLTAGLSHVLVMLLLEEH